MPSWRRSYRKPTDWEAEKPEVLIAKGNISPNDKKLLTQLLGRFGLTTEYVARDVHDKQELELAQSRFRQPTLREETSRTQFSFTNITSPDDYLVREHLVDFRDRTDVLLHRAFVGKTFNYMVDGLGPKETHRYVPNPEGGRNLRVERKARPLDGIEIALRTDLDIPRYKGPNDMGKVSFCAKYAVQVGSIVDVALQGVEPPSGHLKGHEGMLIVASVLQEQIGL